MEEPEPFDAGDAEAVHAAARQWKAIADARREKMPSSSKAMEEKAARLEIVRDKILDRLPEQDRRSYP